MVSGHGGRPTIAELARGVIALACAVVVRLVLDRVVVDHAGTGALFALGFLIIAGHVCGSIAAFMRLPRLTGYILAGLAAGPQGAGLIGAGDVKALALVNALALALIALQAGAEITLSSLRRTWWSVSASAIAQVFVVTLGSAAVFWFAAPAIPFAADLEVGALAAIALVWGTIAFTRSPAVTLAIIAETRARGPLVDWSIGIVVVLDVAILPLFAVALAVLQSEMLGDAVSLDAIQHVAHELFASTAAGVTFGLLIGALFLVVKSERVLALVVLSYGVTALSAYLGYDTLFVFVVAGFVVMNLTRSGPGLLAANETTSSAVMILFFATAGAKLDLHALGSMWPAVAVLFLARIALSALAALIGHRMAKDAAPVRSNGWLMLVPQAGVSIGLANVASEVLPGIGAELAALCVAVVALNTLVGAVLTKWALARAGELPTEAAAKP